MPQVRSYFRRSPGAAQIDEQTKEARRLQVTIYDANGDTFKNRGDWTVSSLRFSTALPGGFEQATVDILAQLPSFVWAIRAGLKVIVRRGSRIVWWGWIEDIERVQGQNVTQIRITALGPWQEIAQRRIDTVSYSSPAYGDVALKFVLPTYCPNISTNHNYIASTSADLGSVVHTFWPMSELVDLICRSGNSSDQPMLFAVWEPIGTTDLEPVAHLWAQDLTNHDYLLHTHLLASGLPINTSTRRLANAVLATYGGSTAYTAYAENSASQTLYRRRDHIIEAGSRVDSTGATLQRDTYLAEYADPVDETGDLRLAFPGAITDDRGLAIPLELIRAGDRLKIADGQLAGTIVMLERTEWTDGQLSCRPQSDRDLIAYFT